MIADDDLAADVVENDAPLADEPAHEEAQDDAPAPPSLEDLAGEMGWRPQEEWKGDPAAWKPAHDFIKRTVDVNHKLNSRLKGVEEQLSSMARTSATITQRAVDQEREKLMAERQQAFDEGDAEKFYRVDRELGNLEAVKPDVVLPEETKAFLERNQWMNTDKEAAAWAQHRAGELSAQGIGPARQLQIVEREAKNLFPEHFETKQPARPAPLSSPGRRGSAPQAKGFNAMPKDAQSAALDYDRRGVCTKDEYAALYWDQFGE